MPVITIRDTVATDVPQLLVIHAQQYAHLPLELESLPEAEEELLSLIESYQTSHAFLTCQWEEEPVGFAYAYPFSPRTAYRQTANLVLFMAAEFDQDQCKELLYLELEKRLYEKGIHHLMICCLSEQNDQRRFFQNLGFVERGEFPAALTDQDRHWDLLWLSKEILHYNHYPLSFNID